MIDLTTVLQVTCWVCLGLVLYTYAGYPVLIRCLSAALGQRRRPPAGDPAALPQVSLLIAAHNEAPVIAARIENALALDYPNDRLEVVVATDGCTDATADVVRGFAGRGVRLLEYGRRRGKTAVLNESIPRLAGEVVILSDANTLMAPDAARALVRWFRNPRVGVVCGRLVLTDPASGLNSDGLYWRYETFLKTCESRLGALLGANGGIYALRKACFRPVPGNTIVDDFVIPLTARLETGCAILYDPEAVAHEETPPALDAEFRRRVRIGAGGFQSLGRLWRLLNPARGWVAFTFLSHKILRWGCPLFLVGSLVTSGLLLEHTLYRALFVGQLAFYALSGLLSFSPPGVRVLRPLRLTTMFTGMNLALLVGFWRWARGGVGGAWVPTARPAT
ncbi:glycosyltransferase family 2 protein [bacterium]|nr:glycosyltransferase family 2 protein [bacterium]